MPPAGEKTSFPKSKINILLLENVSSSAVELLRKEGFNVETYAKLSDEELREKIKTAHAIGVRSKTKLTSSILSEAKHLLAIGCFCIGTDQTDLDFAAKMGVPVFNAPFANTRSVAEMCLAEIIMLARGLGDRSMECHRGEWNKISSNCFEIRGKTLGIIGYGHVGSQLSVLAEAIGMNVVYYDIIPKLPLGNAKSENTLRELLSKSDFVSLHVPATPQTEGLIGPEEIACMKKGAHLLNASRGSVVDINALSQALRNKHLGGCAVDVFPVEPAGNGKGFQTPLQGCPNTILTPHIGGSTEEAQVAIGFEVASKFIRFINEGLTIGAVNFPEVSPPDYSSGTHRILNVHVDQPGVLKDINYELSNHNISSQILRTLHGIGYLVVDIDSTVGEELKAKLKSNKYSIKTRILY